MLRDLVGKVNDEPLSELSTKNARALKTRIDKSYLAILRKHQVTKDEIFKHKLEVNKIIDEIVAPDQREKNKSKG